MTISRAALLVLLTIPATITTAEPVVYEGFSGYATGSSVIGQQDGTGFSGAWNGRRNLLNSGSALPASPVVNVLGSSLSYTAGTPHQRDVIPIPSLPPPPLANG